MPRYALDRNMKLGEFVTSCRARHDPWLTQTGLANQARLSRDQIASIESGRTKVPPPDTLNSIAQALDTPVIEFLERIGYQITASDTEIGSLDARLTRRLRELTSDEQQAMAHIADELIDLRHRQGA